MHPDHLIDLQQHRAYPSVSVLLPTTPGPRMVPADRERLERMLVKAERRLTGDVPDRVRDDVVARLADQARSLLDEPVGRSVAVYAAPGRTASHVLGVPVRERLVVDETFATRDLVHHVRRTVPVTVLVVSEQRLRALVGTPDVLWEVRERPFPLERDEEETPTQWARRCDDAVRTLAPPVGGHGPVVVAGVERTARAFAARLEHSVAGIIRGGHDRSRPAELSALAAIHVDAHLAGEELSALQHLDLAVGQRLLATDIGEIWDAAFGGRVALLVAERGHEVPAVVDGGRLEPVPPERTEDPDVIDDAVDELIEAVALKGGAVCLVRDGAMAGFGRIAAVLRY